MDRFSSSLLGVVLSSAVLACGTPDAQDEAKSGSTLRGTPLFGMNEPECFPAEARDLLWEMDLVATGPGRELKPLDFDENGDGRIDDTVKDALGLTERDAIRGRNTWLVWGGGNEAFWGWLQEQGYGITDFLILLDSRERNARFATTGLINQPGFASSGAPFLGLYLDQEAKPGSAMLHPPGPRGAADSAGYAQDSTRYYDAPEVEHYDAQGRRHVSPVKRPERPPECVEGPFIFTPWTTAEERARAWKAQGGAGKDPLADYVPEVVRRRLVQDGFDPAVYGYPSGVFGLRLHLNPDFFAKTEQAERARDLWRERVDTTNGRYYVDSQLRADPDLVRPFRVSMSCGFCHIGPHPLNPLPTQAFEHPEWKHLSGIIGGQYWDAQPSLGNLLARKDFLHHFLKSQAPGTVDTSLISTDQINNTNVINAVFDVPARLERAASKPTETQSEANRLLLGIEDLGKDGKERHFPMVLFPGEDSVGVFGALARVYLNIGLFSEQWNRVDNPVIGLTPQRPFSVATSRSNSVYWNVNEKYRVPYLAKFFTLGTSKRVPKSTAPMLLADVDGGAGRSALAADSAEQRVRGRQVFVEHCAICHSSKQPKGFDLRFDLKREVKDWTKAAAPAAPSRIYTLPADYANWDAFKESPAYEHYQAALKELSDPGGVSAYDGQPGSADPFIADNFLSNELRIPVTLVGTYSGRAMATNAMRGQVWDNFSSETFKQLPSVGPVRFYDPYAGAKPDWYGTNASYTDGRTEGGPGYFRPASLIGVWATAPYFHNNALGIYTHDPSLSGRLLAFDDGIRKLLSMERRDPHWRPRPARGAAAHNGNGSDGELPCIYRLTVDTRPADASPEGYCVNRIPDGKTYRDYLPPGDLRLDAVTGAAPDYADDPGYIYRLPVDAQFAFAPKFIRPLIEGVLTGYLGSPAGRIVFSFLSIWLWVALVALFAFAAMRGRARHVGVLLLVLAVVLAGALAVTGIGGSGGTAFGAMMMLGMGITSLVSVPPAWLWAAALGAALLGFVLLLTSREWRRLTRGVFAALAVAALAGGVFVNRYLEGRSGGIHLAPIPRGTPVNLLMNIDPEKTDQLPGAVVALVRAIVAIGHQDLTGDAAHREFSATAGRALMKASKVPDFVLDRGHWFGERLSPEEKEALIAFLKTL